jgi:plasmid stabilization system protein ParE
MPADSGVEFHEEASAEYDAAFDWYLERSTDAALKFDAEVNRAVGQISEAPERWASSAHFTRRFLLRRFPFVLIYRERSSDNIQIVAVAHTSREAGILEAKAVESSCPQNASIPVTLCPIISV